MIVCSRCGKENQAHYKFCLGCGGDLSPSQAPAVSLPSKDDTARAPSTADSQAAPATAVAVAPAARPVTPPPTSAPAPAPAPAVASAPVPAPASTSGSLRTCPNCGHGVPPEFVFCGQCGTRLGAESKGPAVPHVVQPAPQLRGRLVLIRPDGSEGGFHSIGDGESVVGRSEGPLFETDSYLSPRHAIFFFQSGSLFVKDTGSLNGVFVKMAGEEEIADGEVFRMGQELMRFDALPPAQPLDDGTEVMGSPNPGFWGRISIILGRDQDGAAFPLHGDAMVIGRERGDILFPDDGYVSGTHARISRRNGRYFLADLNSSNGSFLRIRGERALRSGAFLLLGQQLFRVQYA